MNCKDVPKEQLISELTNLRQQNSELELLDKERKKTEEHLKRRLHYEKMVADVSTLAISAEDPGSFQERCLEIIGRALNLSRTYIFRHRHETDTMDNTFEWVDQGISPQKELLQGVSSRDAPWWMEMMRNNRIIDSPDIEDLPCEAERNICRNQQIKSLLAVPIYVKKEYYGFIGFDECRRRREWPSEDVALLRTVSEIMAMVLDRAQDRQKLVKNEALLRATIESLPFDLFVLDKNGRYSIINSICRRRWGEAVGKRPEELTTDAGILGLWRENNRRAFSGKTVKEEIKQEIDGKTEYIYNIISPVLVGEEVSGIVGINIDMTDRRRMEEELRRSEKRYRDLVENMSEVVYVIDRSGKISFISPSVLNLGYSPSEVIGRRAEEFIHKEDLSRFRKNMQIAMEGKDLVENEYRFVSKEGDIRWIATTSRPVHAGAEIAGVQGLLQDITERKRTEEALRKSEALLVATQQLSRVGGWEWDIENQAMFWTEEVYRIHEFESDEVAPGSAELISRSLLCYEPRDRPVIEAAFRSCAEKGEPYDLEFPFTTAKGRRLWIRTTACPALENGKVVKVVGNIMDITERRRMEEALRKAYDEMEKRVEERTERLRKATVKLAKEHNRRKLLAGKLIQTMENERREIAMYLHDDIGQVLTTMNMALERVEKRVQGQAVLADVVTARERAMEVVRGMRRMIQNLRPSTLDTLGLVPSIYALADRIQKSTAGIGIHVHANEIPEDLAPEKQLALFRIVQEALTNVIKHAYARNVHINLTCKGKRILLSLEDDGVGFASGIVWGDKTDPNCFGLLHMEERAVQNGGKFEIESEEGKGTFICVELPVNASVNATSEIGKETE